MTLDRRQILKASTAVAGMSVLPPSLREALAIPARKRFGTIRDVEHVVILMQENRSFDHYFGALRGVRGFGDPRPIALPGGKPVWQQPAANHADGHILPFHLSTAQTRGQCLESLDHSWKKSQALWKNHDAWIDVKGPMTMGYFTRDDIPFYYALADAFTICDAYHCSIFGPTNPNRLFLFTGTSGLGAGYDGPNVVQNPPEETNESADPANDAPRFKPFGWTTYAERLQAAGIDWRVYQEYDNYGDNALSYFANFRGAEAQSEIGKRARRWAKGSNKDNAKQSRGEHLIAEFAADVAADRLPQVLWVVAPYIMCEHPTATPGYGAAFVSQLLSALAANPAVWAKTAFILNYDENDGFFDHVPPPVPALAAAQGKSTPDVAGEIYRGEPVGFGPRVPLVIVSPWTRGGWVNSQLFDHTSVIRFLEARFGVAEPNISQWRRAMAGDLTSAFDFAQAGAALAPLPDTRGTIERTDLSCTLSHPRVPQQQSMPPQESGQRPARALPYDIAATGSPDETARGFRLQVENKGAAGAALTLRTTDSNGGPWHYAVEAGKTVTDLLPVVGDRYAFALHGPNGFLREFHGRFGGDAVRIAVSARYDALDQSLVLRIANPGSSACALVISANRYLNTPPRNLVVAAASSIEDRWKIESCAHWYDLSVRIPSDEDFLHRLAGHVETGLPSLSDPAFGSTTA